MSLALWTRRAEKPQNRGSRGGTPHLPLIINIFLVSPGLISSQGAATSARARPLFPSHVLPASLALRGNRETPKAGREESI